MEAGQLPPDRLVWSTLKVTQYYSTFFSPAYLPSRDWGRLRSTLGCEVPRLLCIRFLCGIHARYLPDSISRGPWVSGTSNNLYFWYREFWFKWPMDSCLRCCPKSIAIVILMTFGEPYVSGTMLSTLQALLPWILTIKPQDGAIILILQIEAEAHRAKWLA